MPEGSVLRRFLITALISSSLAFAVAAAPPPPLPSPAPAPAGIEQMPSVVIYPFDVQQGSDPRIGIAIAQILAQEMNAAGGITVLPVQQGIKRADFLTNAHTQKADFYISGYVTPVGDSAAVVEQVVSVESGVILFSQTAQVASVADVASQSLLAREQILAVVGRGTENVQTRPNNTPAPTSTNGAQVPIQGLGSIVSSVFGKHRSSHTPTPGPVVKPSRGVIVAPVSASGAIGTTDLTSAGRELYFAMNGHFKTQMTSVTSNAQQSADTICGPNRDNTVATGTLAESSVHRRTEYQFDLFVYTCFGATLGHHTGKASSIKNAVDTAVSAYATAHPDNS
jgi:TolB-like protein